MNRPTDSEAPENKPGVTHTESRRRLLRGGLAAAPVLMTLANRPAFGANGATPSAFGSMNSSRTDSVVEATGVSPGYWKNHTANWPSPYRPLPSSNTAGFAANSPATAATLFDDVFVGGRFPGKTLLQILSPEQSISGHNGGNVAVARAITAALLNAASGKTSSILNVDQVKAIWAEFVNKGYYSPTNGIKWYANYTEPMPSNPYYGGGIIGYLGTTWS
ncbi:MAG: hypothetical protein ACM3SV_13880 [Betaproteobacteria bacterium]